ncbi:hypothetical protein [Capnocytophaga canimorsus]|uniref:hypothetical protein n=1 Tax=Capnocytophaga canimorsus TaxID=28188 RepID=UPI0012FFB0B7|nr:hypothetical protein [Capnocytophaga canimorsus]
MKYYASRRNLFKISRGYFLHGNNQWNKAIFTLFPNGNFDMEFIWDQAWHDEIVRLSKS